VILLSANASNTDANNTDWDLRVYALNRDAQTLLTKLRVWNALDQARLAPVDAMDISGDGARAGRLRFDAYAARSSQLAWIVEDRNLNVALDAALQFAPNLRVLVGRAQQLDVHPERASIKLENNDVIDAALIVGADGAQSWVRTQCDIGIDYRSYGQRAVVANFSCERPHNGVAWQWFTGEEGIVALLPLPGQRVSLVWSAPDTFADVLLRESPRQIAERLMRLSKGVIGQLQPLPPERLRALPLMLLRPHAMIAPRVALVGDAAHVIHPLAGHGMNLGFADVTALLRVQAEREPHRDCGDARVLARYARLRKEDVLLMQIATDGLERLFAVELEPLRVARNLGLNLVNSLPVLKRMLISRALGKQ
jgi:ubiquinone biosynthesis UbiH/UbiF/VisC/COQ6 family hydroxylase